MHYKDIRYWIDILIVQRLWQPKFPWEFWYARLMINIFVLLLLQIYLNDERSQFFLRDWRSSFIQNQRPIISKELFNVLFQSPPHILFLHFLLFCYFFRKKIYCSQKNFFFLHPFSYLFLPYSEYQRKVCSSIAFIILPHFFLTLLVYCTCHYFDMYFLWQ